MIGSPAGKLIPAWRRLSSAWRWNGRVIGQPVQVERVPADAICSARLYPWNHFCWFWPASRMLDVLTGT